MIKWYKSETYWFNIFLAIIGILETNIGLLKSILGDNYGVAVILIGIAGVMLRNTTTQPIDKRLK